MPDVTKEFRGQKLPYMTNPQKECLERSRTTKISYNSFKKLLEASLENLNKPEASWTRADLIASGAQFPSPGSIITGRTVFIDPNNTFLVGYKAFSKMISCYEYMAVFEQTVNEDTVRCKEYMYLAAYCQKYLCGWPQDDELHVTIDDVSLYKNEIFLESVIADAPDDFIAELGNRLMMPERNWDKITTARGKATVFLAVGKFEEAYQYAEQLQTIADRRKKPVYFWRHYAQGIKQSLTMTKNF